MQIIIFLTNLNSSIERTCSDKTLENRLELRKTIIHTENVGLQANKTSAGGFEPKFDFISLVDSSLQNNMFLWYTATWNDVVEFVSHFPGYTVSENL